MRLGGDGTNGGVGDGEGHDVEESIEGQQQQILASGQKEEDADGLNGSIPK